MFASTPGFRRSDIVRNDDGSITVLTLFLILMMLLMGGIAVDMMRYETNRARLQSTIDRAVLAAADVNVCLDPAVDPADVAADYMSIHGFGSIVNDIVVDQDARSCSVTVDAELEVNTIFMSMVGVNEVGGTSSSAATQSITDVELSLVLDISGSMGQAGKLDALIPAATEFTETMFAASTDGNLTMSMVPYSTQVTLGADLMGQFRLDFAHDYSSCIEVPVDLYGETGMPTARTYNQLAHFDGTPNASIWWLREATNWVCNPAEFAEVVPFQTTPDAIVDAINTFNPTDWTSIEMGAKWGLALLDTDARPVVDGLIAEGVVDPALAGQPYDYTPGESLKVLVVMTDGENTLDYRVRDQFRDQMTNVWLGYLDPALATQFEATLASGIPTEGPTNPGWIIGAENTGALPFCAFYNWNNADCGFDQSYNGSVADNPYYFVGTAEAGDLDGDGLANEAFWVVGAEDRAPLDGGDLLTDDMVFQAVQNGQQQSWQDIFARWRVATYATNFAAAHPSAGLDATVVYDQIIEVTRQPEKDARLLELCQAARDEGVVIFTIGFQIEERAAQVMSDCATSPGHYFQVDDLDIAAAFDQIASSVSQLRLTQ